MNNRLYVIGHSPRLVAHVIRGLKERGETRPGEDGDPCGLEEDADVYLVLSNEQGFEKAKYLLKRQRLGKTIVIDATVGGGFAKKLIVNPRRAQLVLSSMKAFDEHAVVPSQDQAA